MQKKLLEKAEIAREAIFKKYYTGDILGYTMYPCRVSQYT